MYFCDNKKDSAKPRSICFWVLVGTARVVLGAGGFSGCDHELSSSGLLATRSKSVEGRARGAGSGGSPRSEIWNWKI